MANVKIAQALQNLDSTGGMVEFYQLEIPEGGTYRATPNCGAAGLYWQGNLYTALPLSTSGWDISGSGTLPRPVLALSNVHHVLLAEVITMGDLVGGRLTRTRTFEQFIDGGSEADPNAHLPLDVFFIEQLIEHTPTEMRWQLTSVLDRFGMQLPRRQVLKDRGFPGVGRVRIS